MENAKQVMPYVIGCLFILIILTVLAKQLENSFISKPNWIWSDNWRSAQMQPLNQPPQAPPSEEPKPKDEGKQIVTHSFKEAKKLADKNKKDILAVFGYDACTYCKKLERETLSNAKVKEAMKKYVFFESDVQRDSTYVQYNLNGFPSILILDKNGQVKKSKIGYIDANQMETFLK
mgnify:CR=1 FL=1